MSHETPIPTDSFAQARQRLIWWHVWNLPDQARVYHAAEVDQLLDAAQAEIERLQTEIHDHSIRTRHILPV